MTDPSSQYLLRDVVPLEVTSDVTGRTISVNPDMMRFALLPGWHPEALEAVRTDYEQLNVGGYKPVRLGRILAQPVLEAAGFEGKLSH